MAKETITFKATETLQALAKKAVEIQDACNALAVTNFLMDVQRYFRNEAVADGQKYAGGDMAIQNPVSITVINKLEHLAKMEQGRPMAMVKCMELADGNDVEWEIDFLA